jgi:hypothetical protein
VDILRPKNTFYRIYSHSFGKNLVLNYVAFSGTRLCHENRYDMFRLFTRSQVRGSGSGVENIEASYSGSDWRPTSENCTMYRLILFRYK